MIQFDWNFSNGLKPPNQTILTVPSEVLVWDLLNMFFEKRHWARLHPGVVMQNISNIFQQINQHIPKTRPQKTTKIPPEVFPCTVDFRELFLWLGVMGWSPWRFQATENTMKVLVDLMLGFHAFRRRNEKRQEFQPGKEQKEPCRVGTQAERIKCINVTTSPLRIGLWDPFQMALFWLINLVRLCDLTQPHPKWWFSKGNPLISGKPRLVKYYNSAR